MLMLRQYQEKHVEELTKKISEFIALDSNKVCVFKAPTGSGKTIMMAEVIKRLVDHKASGQQLAFIWITVHKLHQQSKESLENYYERLESIRCSYFDDLEDKKITDGEILFFNWPAIYQEDNIYIRDNENDFNLSNVISNTKESGCDIILIIDESHHTASGDKSRDVINMIKPKVTVEVSATPKILDSDSVVSVDINEVKEEEMIKKSIQINPDLKNIVLEDNMLRVSETTTDELLIKLALEKRQKLREYYKDESADVNPLVLIQLPDRRHGVDRKTEIIRFLDRRFNINVNNGKLAIHMAGIDDKINLENIVKNNDKAEVLIFKQALVVGWDCPRASILVLFREWNNFVFSIQTIGRIIRMPETVHYSNDELNHAIVYTNMSNITIAEDIAKDFVTVYESRVRSSFISDVKLHSIYIQRAHEKTRLTGRFTDFFIQIADEDQLITRLDSNPSPILVSLTSDGSVMQIDRPQNVPGNEFAVVATQLDTQQLFDALVYSLAVPFATQHSSERIKRALLHYFKMQGIIDIYQIQKIVLHPSNKSFIIDTVVAAKEKFKNVVSDVVTPVVIHDEKWTIPHNIRYTNTHKQLQFKKSIMDSVYVSTVSDTELQFMKFLDDVNNSVKWWFKNGVNEKKYFAIEYIGINDNTVHAFYIDFIVCMNDGRIGLFDTKSGFTESMAQVKAESLSNYISKNTPSGMFGGIVIIRDGIWFYNDKPSYRIFDASPSDWHSLSL